MRDPAREPAPELDAEGLRVFAELVTYAQKAGQLPRLLPQAMPWARPLPEDDLSEFAAELADAAASGEHAPERLAAVMRAWQETAEILGDPEAMAELAQSAEAIARGDVVRGPDAVRI